MSLSRCSTLTGDLEIGPSFEGVFSLVGVQEIKGGFRAEGVPALTSVVAKDLDTIDGPLALHELKAVTSLAFPVLGQVLNISLVNLPELSEIQFPVNVSSEAILADNVGLEQVEIFGTPTAQQFTFTVLNNAKVTKLAFFNVTAIQALLVAGNNPSLELSMDSLINVTSINIWNVYDLSLKNLTTVQGSLELVNNTFSTNLSLPSLVSVHDSLTIDSHLGIDTISLPSLDHVGGSLQIAANPNLHSVSLPALSYAGDLDVSGNVNR